ncbi:uncharacterized protein BX663DRAFT_555804 [Cokeromyces recurvatus]|uniref:uncharacterized protein n=1 Tax=Cokeromyces recurvatus TaxID=90255 RepID=UPI002220665D|nr:uncharacterized protein BX663DRAFT_555804 [Cokeromyces recurvatus]KAI7898442.1 hypothetical protein BX663DRAFT_555804 [Cokeromyces recurvatus]
MKSYKKPQQSSSKSTQGMKSIKKSQKPKKFRQSNSSRHKETKETKFINEKYLSITRAPSFNDFASKLTGPIAVKYYKTAVLLYRLPGAALQKQPKTTTITFKTIFSLTSALIPSVQVDEVFSGEEEGEKTVVDDNDDGYENEEVEANKNSRHVEEEQASSVEEDIVDDSNENSSVDEDVEDGVNEAHDKLVQSLISKILNDKFIKVYYEVKNKSNLVQVLYQKAASATQDSSTTKEYVEFLKLSVSKCFNMVHPLIRQRSGSVLSKDQLKTIYKVCSHHKNKFESMSVPNSSCIDKLFDELKQFQHDVSDHPIKTYIDNEKSKETNKNSDHYLLLKIIERRQHIDNFKKLEKKNISESTFCSIFRDIVDVILYNTNIEIDDG